MNTTISHWSVLTAFPLLSVMTLLPLLTIIGVWRLPCAAWSLRFAYAGAALNVLLGVYLLLIFDTNSAGIHLAEQVHFWGMSYAVGVDSTNILFIPLTALLTLLALFYISTTRHASDKWVINCLLVYETILIGAFAALNVLQFWFWSVLELVPVILLTVHSGTGQQRRWAAVRVLQYWGAGLLMTLAGFLLLAFGLIDADHPLSFDWLLLKQSNAYLNDEVLIFLLLFFGFAVRMPLFPFHGWLPPLAEHGTVASTAVYLLGLKLGVYALIRFILPIVPGVAEQWAGFVLILAISSIFYGLLQMLAQINIRRLFAFMAVSHSGVLVVAAFNFNAAGLEGSLFLSSIYGLATVAMLFCAGSIYGRTRTAFIPRLVGAARGNILLTLVFLAAIVMPTALVYLSIINTLDENDWLMMTVFSLANVLMVVFLLRNFQQLFISAPKRRQQLSCIQHSALKECVIAFVVGGLLIVSGFCFTPWLKFVSQDAVAISLMFPMHNVQQHHDK